jgi:hypothetical protein
MARSILTSAEEQELLAMFHDHHWWKPLDAEVNEAQLEIDEECERDTMYAEAQFHFHYALATRTLSSKRSSSVPSGWG